jgi:hypothetical protein
MPAADDHGMIAQVWIVTLFHACVKGVAIHMRDA